MEFNLSEMSSEDLTTRKAELASNLEAEGIDLDAIEEEVRAINAEMESRKATEEAKVEERKAVAEDNSLEVIETSPTEERKDMEKIEVRNTAEYIDQFAEYIKTEKRGALLSENVENGVVAVPDLVYGIVETAWSREGIMSRVRKSYLAGNLKVGFEISATGAVKHTEGADAPAQETLVLGIVEMVPASLKKWITISDEVMDMRGEAFLQYVYNEVAYQIAQAAAKELIDQIKACGTQSTTTCVGVPTIKEATIGMATVAKAIAQLTDEATEPVIMMNKLTWSEFKAVQYANGYGADPFEGLPVEFNSNITAYSAATTGVPYLIVGDLANGALANFPNGQDIKFKFDDLSLAESDLVKIVGREYVAVAPIKPNAFVKVTR